MNGQKIVVSVLINRRLGLVWKNWTNPEDIKQWNIPFTNWHCPEVVNEVKEGGTFCFKMQTKNGKEGFNHTGRYDTVIPFELIAYTLDDGRKSIIEFQQIDDNTIVRESFEPEKNVPYGLQQEFCQSVLNKFKQYTENI